MSIVHVRYSSLCHWENGGRPSSADWCVNRLWPWCYVGRKNKKWKYFYMSYQVAQWLDLTVTVIFPFHTAKPGLIAGTPCTRVGAFRLLILLVGLQSVHTCVPVVAVFCPQQQRMYRKSGWHSRFSDDDRQSRRGHDAKSPKSDRISD